MRFHNDRMKIHELVYMYLYTLLKVVHNNCVTANHENDTSLWNRLVMGAADCIIYKNLFSNSGPSTLLKIFDLLSIAVLKRCPLGNYYYVLP